MRFLSLFSGIEAASLAWEPLGWTCAGVAEIEPFPCAVLARHHPLVRNFGDVSNITKKQVLSLDRIDLVVGGFPCQDVSIAGKRRGFKNSDGTGTRSGLFHEAMRIIRYAREFSGLRWAVIENVPGLFNSHGGRDFAAVVGALAGTGFDVPRDGWRNTGCAVGPNGLVEWSVLDARWRGLAQRRERVFLVCDFGAWSHRPPVLLERESMLGNPPSREKTRQEITGGAEGGALDGGLTVSMALNAHPGGSRYDGESETFVTPPLRASDRRAAADGNHTEGDSLVVTHALTGEGFDASEDGTGRGTPMVPEGSGVRRLTVTECERLMGVPDGYTAVPFRGKVAADGPRYKALGNSMAVPVMRWIGERIQLVSEGGGTGS
jgi:DNA (cytosine-5)-methyltransferase 1